MPHRRRLVPILFMALCFLIGLPQGSNEAPQKVNGDKEKETKNTPKQLVYENERYGFSFSLPLSWKGYRILVEQWTGNVMDERGASERSLSGPLIKIRNPLWTEKDPYQDIPILVFTQSEWKLIESESLVVSGAPIGPMEIGRNATYVFALPPRYNFGDAKGQDEVSDIVEHSPIHALKSR